MCSFTAGLYGSNNLSHFNMHPHDILHYDSCKIFSAFTLTKTNTNLILKSKTKQNQNKVTHNDLTLNFNVREIFCDDCGSWYHFKEPVPLSLTYEANKP
jgi:uncharacterized protein YbaR (Trm112 family)